MRTLAATSLITVWKAADDIDVFESGWTFDHFYPIFSDPTGLVASATAIMSATYSQAITTMYIS